MPTEIFSGDIPGFGLGRYTTDPNQKQGYIISNDSFGWGECRLFDLLRSDSTMCPRCGKSQSVGCAASCWHYSRETEFVNYEFVLICPNCLKPFIVSGSAKSSEFNPNNLKIEDENYIHQTFPPNIAKYEPEINQWRDANVPLLAIEAYSEGTACLASGNYRAACTMFRGALECVLDAIENASDQNILANKIKNANLPENLTKVAKGLKDMGNFHAHMDAGSFSATQRSDATTMMELLKIVVKILYIDKYEAAKLLKYTKGQHDD